MLCYFLLANPLSQKWASRVMFHKNHKVKSRESTTTHIWRKMEYDEIRELDT